MEAGGNEHLSNSASKDYFQASPAQNPAHGAHQDPRLSEIQRRWYNLPKAVRARIMELCRSVEGPRHVECNHDKED
jgi:hypothetical protein